MSEEQAPSKRLKHCTIQEPLTLSISDSHTTSQHNTQQQHTPPHTTTQHNTQQHTPHFFPSNPITLPLEVIAKVFTEYFTPENQTELRSVSKLWKNTMFVHYTSHLTLHTTQYTTTHNTALHTTLCTLHYAHYTTHTELQFIQAL